jgi:4-amino-4-deoxy-L-arabinose transferase-like glycosyltransferase
MITFSDSPPPRPEPHPVPLARQALFRAAILLLIGIALLRIVSTYGLLSPTVDESFHIAAGMEWLDRGQYQYEWQHPPLARIAVAIGPFLRGIRSHGMSDAIVEGNAILLSGDQMWATLTSARLGTLPFLLLACVMILLWSRRWFDDATAFWALAVFLALPPVLGHSALATLDIACTATFLLATYHVIRWMEAPTAAQSLKMSLGLAIAWLTKFSTVPFVLICATIAFALSPSVPRSVREGVDLLRTRMPPLLLAAACALVVIWSFYFFDIRPISTQVGSHETLDLKLADYPVLKDIAYKLVETPIPLAEFLGGIKQVARHNRTGHDSFLLGEYSETGWWHFFLVVLAVKTPLAFQTLAVCGWTRMLRQRRSLSWQQLATGLFPLALIAFSLTSRINLGIRHILPVLPLLCIVAGFWIRSALRTQKPRLVGLAVVLAGILILESAGSHPDYLAYFNPLAGSHPERILADSDLDWGQDLHRLSARLRERDISPVSIAYFGTFPLHAADLPPFCVLTPGHPATGYVAVSVREPSLTCAKVSSSYCWLNELEPEERIGKSILLYHVTPEQLPKALPTFECNPSPPGEPELGTGSQDEGKGS